jgi:hypothetical protein
LWTVGLVVGVEMHDVNSTDKWMGDGRWTQREKQRAFWVGLETLDACMPECQVPGARHAALQQPHT